MKPLKNRLSIIFGVLAASTLAATMVVAPALATESTAINPYEGPWDGSDSTETDMSGVAHYYDYSPEINITYSWWNDFEWTYLKSGNLSFWSKGGSESEVVNFLNKNPNININSLSELDWAAQAEELASIDNQLTVCIPMRFENKAGKTVQVAFKEEPITFAESVIGGVTTSSTKTSTYLRYWKMRPYSSGGTTTTLTVYEATIDRGDRRFLYVGGNSSKDVYGLQGNKAFIGIQPSWDFVPNKYTQWVPENAEDENGEAGKAIKAQLRLVFKKYE